MWTGNISGLESGVNGENKEKFLFGIYKILMDTIHALMDSINYVAKKINPSGENGAVTIISTGHSLGGALATIFGYVYVSHISNLPNHSTLYPKLNVNIGCFSLGSPRVFSPQLAKRFCQLTQNNQEVFKEDQEYQQFIQKADIKGRITFLRIVSYKDPVPMLPPAKFGFSFEHPCSGDERTRKNTNVDCLVQIENSFSTRCAATKRLAMTYNFQDLPLNCVDTKEARQNGLQGPSLAKNPMSYHTEYLGISFIGGINFDNIIGNNPARVRETINLSKKGDTVCRVLFYPSVQDDMSTASVGFYDLSLRRSKSNEAALNVSDVDLEVAEATENLEGIELIKKEENKQPTKAEVKPRSEYTDKVLKLYGSMIGAEKIVEVPQDIYDTEDAFQQIIQNTETYDILTTKAPPIVYSKLVDANNNSQTDPSFEGANKFGSVEMVSLPKEITGGRATRRTRTRRRYKKCKKTRKQKRRKTRKRRRN
jgi:hypothetical protein